MKTRYLILLCGSLTFAGCGGGGGGGTSVPPVTSTPTPNPSALAVTPSQVGINAAGGTATFVASEGNNTGQFSTATANSSCANIATVAPAAGTPNGYTVTAKSTAGTCTINVQDRNGQATTVTVTVTLTQGTIQ